MDDLLEITSRVEAEHFWFRGFRAFVQPLMAEAASGRGNLRMLDCGCGTGHNLALLAQFGTAVGFDLTQGGLALAQRSGYPLVRAEMSAIPFQSSSFDILTSFDVLQYVADDGLALREVARLLRPGGTAIITASALEVLRGGHAGAWPEVRRYTKGRMREIVEGAGLQVQRLTYLFGSLLPMMLAVRMLRRRTEADGAGEDWEMKVPAAPLNNALTWLLRAEATLTRHAPLTPAGSSVLVVARKRG
jgi:ubiquinone/menaquinone biosynthesis C-methylase UbiE